MKMRKSIGKLCEGQSVEEVEIPEDVLQAILAANESDKPDSFEKLDGELLDRRMIYLNDEVDKNIIQIAKAFMYWNAEDKDTPIEERTPIKLYICSPGGDLNYMWILIDLMNMSKTPVYTVNMCVAYSAAALLFMGGHRRFMFPHASLMIHQGSAELGGDYTSIRNAFKNYTERISQVYDYIRSSCELPESLIKEHEQEDWYLNPDECLQYKICHAVINSVDDIL